MDEILNTGFLVFHGAWIVFNCLGWIWKRTRPWQVATIALTALSWFGLGIWYGWGYCPCTEWHWAIRARLGYVDPPSYIQLLIRQLIGLELTTTSANGLAVIVLLVSAGLGIGLTLRDRRSRARPAAGPAT